VVTIDGRAGTGKTALALGWAHRYADWFPDGQMLLDLRGCGQAGSPTTPFDALLTMLAALGTEPGRLPTTLDGAVGLYRTLAAGQRVLLVLDNVRDADQVRPLLPGDPTPWW
jgi:hypothetical protein